MKRTLQERMENMALAGFTWMTIDYLTRMRRRYR